MIESVTVPLISVIEPDWSREQCSRWWVASPQRLKSIQNYKKWKACGGIIGCLLGDWNVIQHQLWLVVTAADIPLNCQIEGGLLLTQPNSVVIQLGASIEPNCLFFNR